MESVASGVEAVNKFQMNNYSMVITDVKMPEMSGMEVLEKVKAISPDVPVIMVTAYGTINNAVEAMREGASDYIIKPFSSGTLERAVNKASKNINNKINSKPIDVNSNDGPEEKKFITRDPKLLNILELAKNVAPSKATVLVQGESGTGKEVLASFIHHYSGLKDGRYVAVNCAALPDGLAESEMFGHEKGAFTGAVSRQKGKFELADNGTLVLDEISEMSMPLQAKLLRVLQEREIDRVGGSKPVSINTRVIVISNVDLKKAVADGKFREDLFYRVNVIPLTIPPLRKRKDDIPLLVSYFLEKYSSGGSPVKKAAPETIALLMKYDWKGNVRELENTIERAVILVNSDTILPRHLFLEEPESRENMDIRIKAGLSVREMEKALIFQTLKEVNNNRTHAADMLGISIRTLRNKLREYKKDD